MRTAIPLTSKDDYPFYNVTINWDPPAYHFIEKFRYIVILVMFERWNGRIFRHFVDKRLEVGFGCITSVGSGVRFLFRNLIRLHYCSFR